MGKAKKTTRKELESVIGEIIRELKNLRTGFQALDSYLGHYVEWKNDRPKFEEHLGKILKQKSLESNIQEPKNVNKKDTKKSRYAKVSTV